MKTKILKISGIFLLIFSAFILITPYLFQGKIIRLIRAQAADRIHGRVDFSGADISLFRHFPKLSVGLENLHVICAGEFKDDTVLIAKEFDLICDIRSIISGQSIQVHSIVIDNPRLHAVVHANGHANWNTLRMKTANTDSSASDFFRVLQQISIRQGYAEYLDENKRVHMVSSNINQDLRGHFNADNYTLKTKTSAGLVNISFTGPVPCQMIMKSQIDIDFHVDNKTHTYTFTTDQIAFNDLKFHSEGFFQWINDSSYTMNVKYKVPSTDFKSFLSVVPPVYQKDFSRIVSNGQVNFNGFIKGKYDEKHFPAYHANLYVSNGSFKYPDLPLSVQNIRFGLQINNSDGLMDHTSINITGAHAEIGKDVMDIRMLVKNLKTKPFIDFAIHGEVDLADIPKALKVDPSTRLSGLLTADLYGTGVVPGSDNQIKEKFQSHGEFHLSDFSLVSKTYPGGLSLRELLMTLNPKNILVKELSGEYGSSHIEATATLNNFYAFVLTGQPLSAAIDLKAGEVNVRDWTGLTDADSTAQMNAPVIIPANIHLTVNAEAHGLHFDNLDLQNLSCKMQIADQKMLIQHLKAKGLDGDISAEGSYSTMANWQHPEFELVYDVKNVDVQKTFLAFNSIRRIMPVAKFMTGNLDAHMRLAGKLNTDMTTDLSSLQGEGTLLLNTGSMKDFGPLDNILQTLDIAALKDVSLTNVKSEFSFKDGRVIINPFFVQTKDMEFDIEGTHGFDQSLEYDVSLRLPRRELGRKGTMFVKNVVNQAAQKRIPVKIGDAVRIDVKVSGTINNSDVKTDMDAVVSNAETDLNREVDAFVNAKLDSAKRDVRSKRGVSKKIPIRPASYHSNSGKKKKSDHGMHKTKQNKPFHKKKPVKNYTANAKRNRTTASVK